MTEGEKLITASMSRPVNFEVTHILKNPTSKKEIHYNSLYFKTHKGQREFIISEFSPIIDSITGKRWMTVLLDGIELIEGIDYHVVEDNVVRVNQQDGQFLKINYYFLA